MNESDQIAALEHFLIDNEDFERLESKLSGFNIFESIGAVRQELRHSDFLAFLLNPSASHGLGDTFLKKFLIDILSNNETTKISSLDVTLSGFENTEVRREWRNIDLLIIQPELMLIVAIENKVDSSESESQLNKYSTILKQSIGSDYTVLKVFLTPDGVAPKHEAGWGIYSYQKISGQVESLLTKKRNELTPKITLLLQDYLTLLRRHIVPDQRLVELCRKIYREHTTALDLIYEYKMDIYSEIQSYLTDLIKNDKDLILDDSNKTFIRFRSKTFDSISALDQGDGWTSSKKILLYEFHNRNDSLRLKLVIGPGDSQTRKMIHGAYLANSKELRRGISKLSDKWSQIMRLDVLGKRNYEDLDFEAMKVRIDQFWHRFKEEEYRFVNNMVSEALK